ncbi:MAG: response regulator [Paenibacillaceae bacterium]|nr:response regulator [Paenibacillaceae bacterium]
MKRYQEALILAINKQAAEWFGDVSVVDSADLARFLHSVKGTAATVGLEEVAATSSELLDHAESSAKRQWNADELRPFLYSLLKLCHSFDTDPVPPEELPTSSGAGKGPLILILDDDPIFLMFLKESLEKQDWVVMTAVDPNKAIAYFHDYRPDCFVTDINMPQKNGLEVLSLLREKARQLLIPTIVISGYADKAHRIESYRTGADDYLVKPFDIDELIVRIESQLERKRSLEHLLLVDKLTGAFSRIYLDTAYERLNGHLQQTKESFAVAVLDLDHFKRVNDRYGHLAGDDVLKGFASFIKANVRMNDMLIRYGGEEFVLLLPQTGKAETKRLLEQLLARFGGRTFEAGGQSFQVTFSAGVVEADIPGLPFDHWFKLADHALYAAKEAGRNRVELADGQSDKPMTKKLNVAVIDDDKVVRDLLNDSLRAFLQDRFQLKIRTYDGGVSYFADDGWASREPQLILLDGLMDDMDGLEVLQRLRAMPQSDRFYIIMLTVRKSEWDIVRALEFGADDYLTKPFHMNELAARINRLLRRMK